MTNNKNFQAELAEKVKAGVKPSDLKKSKSTPPSRAAFNNEKYVAELETEKADLLAKLANYEKEQQASVKVFKDQEKLINEKEEQLEKLKSRIHQLFKDKQEKNPEKISTEEIGTQTEEETNSSNWEEALLEKRLQSLKEFSSYRDKLNQKETEIENLTNQINSYQQKIRKLTLQPNSNEKKVVLLTILLIITTSLLLFK